jgi:hypothetical protein
MPIASQYAVLSEDRKSLILPGDIQKWLSGGDKAPLSDEKLNELIHESRK